MKPHAGRLIAVALILGALLASATFGQAKDPFLGTWLLDADHSQFVPGPGPEDRSMIFEMKADGFRHVTKTVNAFLSTTDDIEYTAKFDGKDYPITGTGLDTVSLKRVDANTIERTGKVKGKVTETATLKISADGQTLTVSIKGSYNGTEYNSTQILTRQP